MQKTFINRASEISLMFDIDFTLAACYISNFEDDYICHEFNGECKNLEICRKIREGNTR
jgi:hypothetical protein